MIAAEKLYAGFCRTPRAIASHLPALRALVASDPDIYRILELGTGRGYSLLAFGLGILADPLRGALIRTYDINPRPVVQHIAGLLESIGEDLDLKVVQQDIRRVIWKNRADLIFIDDDHEENHVRKELEIFPGLCNKYLVLHDVFSDKHLGVANALASWEQTPEAQNWTLLHSEKEAHGLTIYQRINELSPETA